MFARLSIFLLVLYTFTTCRNEGNTLFRLVPAEESGLDFENAVEEKDTVNILTVQYMYHGGAVAIGDFNNDSLSDIFFSGNMVPNKLYFNRGGLKLEDVTSKIGIVGYEKMISVVSLVYVNVV